MAETPLRGISISDFRRLEGTRFLALDAPIVLLHGHNGAGKTSVLSALELALTGEIRSMRRHDQRYTAHLPSHGRDFATLSVTVSESLGGSRTPERMTVGGSRIDGTPALSTDLAQFYAERCYLDQVSLGQLLDLYQYREGKEESALARFVNELLGLEQLDALRLGLTDAEDFRRLKKLSDPLANADMEAARAAKQLEDVTGNLGAARHKRAQAWTELIAATEVLGHTPADVPSIGSIREALHTSRPDKDRSTIAILRQSVIALGGRIQVVATRPSTVRLEEAKANVASATKAQETWWQKHGSAIDDWHAVAGRFGDLLPTEASVAIADALRRSERSLTRNDQLTTEVARLQNQLSDHQNLLTQLQSLLIDTQAQTGTLAEGLAALREHASDDICPVCDRAFAEVSSTHLSVHIDRKVTALTNQGLKLRQLREQRIAAATALQRDAQTMEQTQAQLLTESQLASLRSELASLSSLQRHLQELQPTLDTDLRLRSAVSKAEATLGELQSIARDARLVSEELGELARALDADTPHPDEPLQEAWQRIADIVDARYETSEAIAAAHATASQRLEQLLRCETEVERFKDEVAQAAERKSRWDERVMEARRRQSVAKEVQQAALQARREIVHRVFTESLNQVWRSVFTRLAPREDFVPMFGIPTASKAALELTLQTVHPSGTPGGSPQMMLSAGNLNTAALSLFIALHLAVEPVVPCLVFDDPVQSMDEVHVAQFAALMRVLSKQHQRQIIIAVHERELFDYLALELGPAFQGDELITIELGAAPEDPTGGVHRIRWKPDSAIAV